MNIPSKYIFAKGRKPKRGKRKSERLAGIGARKPFVGSMKQRKTSYIHAY